MIKIKLSEEKIIKIKSFLNSNQYNDKTIKSELWKHESKLAKIEFQSNNEIVLKGSGGLYFRKINPIKRFLSNLKSILLNYYSGLPIFPTHKKAYNKIMNDPKPRGGLEFDFNEEKYHNYFKKFSDIKINNPFKNFDFDYYEVKHFYLLNILRSKINMDQINTVLEIGGGSGHFPIIIKNYHKNVKKYISIDLPEILIFNIVFMMFFFPNKTFCLPNEIENKKISNAHYDFIFLTPSQVNQIDENVIDLSINTSSFAEMNKQDIDKYINLVQKVTRNKGFFLNHNRVHKLPEPHSKDAFILRKNLTANIFGDYPFFKNDLLIHDICRFSQLLKIDPMIVRLEQIKK